MHNRTSKTCQIKKKMRYTLSLTIFLLCSILSGAANCLYWKKKESIFYLQDFILTYLDQIKKADIYAKVQLNN